jgi:hypothetical protein
MTHPDPLWVLQQNQAVLETFTTRYLPKRGVQIQLTEAVAKELFGPTRPHNLELAKTPLRMVGQATEDIVISGTLARSWTYDQDHLISGAPSLEFLVRYARMLNPAVLPPEVIPSDEVVNAALALFHLTRGPVGSTS